jgi:hypothetical protein
MIGAVLAMLGPRRQQENGSMATYKVLQKSYIDDQMVEADQMVTVSDDVIPGQHWQPMDASARTAYLERCTTGRFIGPEPRNLDDAPFVEFPEVDIASLVAAAEHDQAAEGKSARRAASKEA